MAPKDKTNKKSKKTKKPDTSASEEETEHNDGFANECQELFETTNLYEVIGLESEAKDSYDSSTIKKAYYRASLKYHPDRCKADDQDLAKRKFQALSKAYSVLSDDERRKIYDETGAIDDDYMGSLKKRDFVKDWQQWFGELDDFKLNFQGSDEEYRQLKQAYVDYQGNMKNILVNVMCASFEDEDRFAALLNKWIAAGDLPDFDAFTKETKASKIKRRKAAEKEAIEAAGLLENIKKKRGPASSDVTDISSLALAIRSKQTQGGSSFLDNLENKYCQPKRKRSKK